MSEEQKEVIPEEFKKIIKDFISDILITFPEYELLISKWWCKDLNDLNYDEQLTKMQFIFNHCLKVFPERFFDILYQNPEIFDDKSNANTEFLPGISFKYLWSCDISEKTKETLWKYLQLILLSIVGSIKNKDSFGDTSKLLDSINEDEFKGKLEETLENMQKIFENTNSDNTNGDNNDEKSTNSINIDNLPSAVQIQDHISGMLGGKLGQLAKEIAEETAENLNIDMENVTDAKGVFQNLFKNPGKLMGLVKNVGDKLDQRIKSGDIKENELYSEATNIMNQMKGMQGMEQIQDMLKQMGMAGSIPNLSKNTKIDVNAMQTQLSRLDKNAKMKETLRKKAESKNSQKIMEQIAEKAAFEARTAAQKNAMSEEELIAYIGDTSSNSNSTEKKKKSKNKKG